MEKITKEQYDMALKVLKLSNTEGYDDVINHLKEMVKQQRAQAMIITNQEEMFRKNWLLNGWAEAIHFFDGNLEIIEKLDNNEIEVENKKLRK